MKTVCEIDQCAGCMACMDICSQNAITIKDGKTEYNAIIDEDKCVNCKACHKVCQNNNQLEFIKPIEWYQGWAEDESIRLQGSSGGIASALSLAFVKNGGYVCSCAFEHGEFKFKLVNCVSELKQFSGSKYVKSNPVGIYKRVKAKLQEKQKVLFIGLPCQISALKNFVGYSLIENLYTVDLICHGTPSPKILDMFLMQYNRNLDTLSDITFRKKYRFQLFEKGKGIITDGVSDSYMISFLNTINYTENCYNCIYAKFERVSDITLGDSWGTSLNEDELSKGVSLVLCQTPKGQELLKQANLNLKDVNIKNAIEHNGQLQKPSRKPLKRDDFFYGINNGKKFNQIVFLSFPKQYLKQKLKLILIRLKLLGSK